jgi:hypothetical protein
MKKRFAITILLCAIVTLGYADDKKSFDVVKKEYDQQLLQLNNTAKQQQEKIRKLENKIREQYKSLNSQFVHQQVEHQKQVEQLTQNLEALNAQQLTSQNKLTQLTDSIALLDKNTTVRSEQLNQSMSYRTISLMIGLLILLALMGISYWLLKKRQAENSKDLSTQVQQALESVRQSEEKMVQSDTQLADRLLEVVAQLKQSEQITKAGNQQHEPDHSLPLKLADEIHRMRKRLAALPEETKGLKPLSKSLERLEEELQEQGYEIIDYTGLKYTENMSVSARFVPSDDLEEGQSIINKVVTPQVNFKGVLIRMADIEVSVG